MIVLIRHLNLPGSVGMQCDSGRCVSTMGHEWKVIGRVKNQLFLLAHHPLMQAKVHAWFALLWWWFPFDIEDRNKNAAGKPTWHVAFGQPSIMSSYMTSHKRWTMAGVKVGETFTTTILFIVVRRHCVPSTKLLTRSNHCWFLSLPICFIRINQPFGATIIIHHCLSKHAPSTALLSLLITPYT